MRKSSTLAVSGFVWLLATCAALSASATPLGLGALASGSTPAPPLPKGAPLFIGAGQVVSGLQVVNNDRFVQGSQAGYHQHTLFTDPARAGAYELQLKSGTDTPFARSET